MKSRKLLQSLVIVIALGVSAGALHAQSYSVFALGGGSSLFDKHTYSVSTGEFGSTYKTGASFTVGGEIPLKKIFGVEGSYSMVRNNLAVTNYSAGATEAGYTIRNQRLSGDLVAHMPKSFLGIKPYLVAGLEYDRFSPVGTASTGSSFNGYSNVTLSPANKLGFNYGGGLDKKLTKLVSLRVDVRDHLTGSPTYGLATTSASSSAAFPITGAAHNLEYSAGVVFHFGK
jgi:opacity protein-like surface antigen